MSKLKGKIEKPEMAAGNGARRLVGALDVDAAGLDWALAGRPRLVAEP